MGHARDAKTDPVTSPYAPDVDAVRTWMEEAIASMSFVKLVATILALLVRMRDINTELMKRVAHLTRKRPPSESLRRLERQLTLPLVDLRLVPPPAKSNDEPTDESKPAKKKKSRRGLHPGRAALPPHLPRVPDPSLVAADRRICPQCGLEMPTLGFSSHEILEIEPARFIVRVQQIERCACAHCDHIVSAKAPPMLVPGGKLGDTLIVEAICDKFIEHQPIERQALRFERAGVDVAPQTLGRSVAVALDKLKPLAELIREQTRGPGLLGTDATSIPVLDPETPDNIRRGTMWVWTNARWVTFVYSPVGDSESVRRFLGEDLARDVQCDGTSVTTFIERKGGTRPGCWSHARRPFAQAARGGDLTALDGLRLIVPLFMIERESTLAGDNAEQRKARRQEKAVPVLEALRAWLDQKRGEIPPKTPLGKALGYLHRQWARLILFLADGNVELTNNRRERELRRLVLGRKNWLFVWLDLGGERAANILSIVATAIAHDLNPRAYLHLVTRLLVRGWPAERLRELLPDRIATTHAELLHGGPCRDDGVPHLAAAP